MGINVIKAGLLSTIQDLGRQGYRKEGIIVGGAMDRLALLIGNLVLGNPEGCAGIECTLNGPELLFESDQLIALTGADLSPAIDGISLKMWRPVFVKKGSVLTFGTAVQGCRAYITVAGGFKLPFILESQSTYLKAGFGGFKGRALKKGDSLTFAKPYTGAEIKSNWTPELSKLYPLNQNSVARIIPGPEYGWFTEQARLSLTEQKFRLNKDADRMGYRLEGPVLSLPQPRELLSSAVTFGTLQVTGNGNPILLMADHQTTGGYPRIAQVISTDHSMLAQLRTGETIRFKLISLSEAHELLKLRALQIKQLKHTLMLKGIL